jgi:hypothetical protein
MALTYGFYNSQNGDRTYDATDISSIFDGIIKDGVFMSIGDAFMVSAANGMQVKVGSGRAWFNHTWTYNSVPSLHTIEPAEIVLNRIDTVVLEINASEEVRANSIKVIKGTPASNPVAPTLINTELVHQYPLADIYVGANVTEIIQANITNRVGTEACPLSTGILETLDSGPLLAQWNSAFTEHSQAWVDRMAQQQNDFDERQITIQAWYDLVRDDITLLQTFNFDNIAELPGCTRSTVFQANGDITETIFTTVGLTTIAVRTTVFNPDDTITVSVIVYDTDGVTEIKNSVITTIFNTDEVQESVSNGVLTPTPGGGSGGGSITDADTVDGKHASDFAPSKFGLGEHMSENPIHDSNDAVTTGMYYVSSADPNKPPGVTDGSLFVTSYSTAWVNQIYMDWRTDKTYRRSRANGVWSPWIELCSQSDLVGTVEGMFIEI